MITPLFASLGFEGWSTVLYDGLIRASIWCVSVTCAVCKLCLRLQVLGAESCVQGVFHCLINSTKYNTYTINDLS